MKLTENFRQKTRFVANGHLMDSPSFITYSAVVSRDSVRIFLLVEALNDLEVMGSDIHNAFISAPNLDKHWIRTGTEFGAEQGKVFIFVHVLYVLKSASTDFQYFMAKKLDEANFKSCVADPDVWLRPAVRPDGTEYYEYILMYVDNILEISVDATKILKSLEGNTVQYTNNQIASHNMYLGAKLQEKDINDVECWTIGSVEYIQAAIATVKEGLNTKRWKLPNKVSTPMVTSYFWELDGSPELEPDDLKLYQELIGMLRWATELVRVDILHEAFLMSQHQASPRDDHPEQVLHIFSFLKKKPKLSLYMNPSLTRMNYSVFKTKLEDFKEYYRDAEEEMPHRMP